MKRSRFSDEQIIGILKEQEGGSATADECRRHGISGATLYKWKAKFGGLGLHEVIHPARRDPANPGCLDHRHQGLLGGLPGLQEGREIAALPQLRVASTEVVETPALAGV